MALFVSVSLCFMPRSFFMRFSRVTKVTGSSCTNNATSLASGEAGQAADQTPEPTTPQPTLTLSEPSSNPGKRSMSRRRGWRGFTLIEVLVVITIMGILVAVAYPGMQRMVRRNRVAAGAQEIAASLSYARTEAIRRNSCVTMCMVASTSSNACVDPNGGASNWYKGGWMVFANPGCKVETGAVAGAASTPVLKRAEGKVGLNAYGFPLAFPDFSLSSGFQDYYGQTPLVFNSRGNVVQKVPFQFNVTDSGVAAGGDPNNPLDPANFTATTAPMPYFFVVTPDKAYSSSTTNKDMAVCISGSGYVAVRDVASLRAVAGVASTQNLCYAQ